MILFNRYRFMSGISAVTSIGLPSFNFFLLNHLFEDGHMSGRNIYEVFVHKNYLISVYFVGITTTCILYVINAQIMDHVKLIF